MQVTISDDEPIEKVLAVVSALYGVDVEVRDKRPTALLDEDQGITRPRQD